MKYHNGMYVSDIEFAELALNNALQLHTEIHPVVRQCLFELGNEYYKSEEYGKAEPIFEKMVQIFEKTSGTNSVDVALSLINLGDLYRDWKKPSDAASTYNRAFEICKKIDETKNPHVYKAVISLSGSCYEGHLFDLCEKVLKLALSIKEHKHPLDKMNISALLNNLGELYLDQEKYEQAEPLFVRAIVMMEEIHGSNHPKVIQARMDLEKFYSTVKSPKPVDKPASNVCSIPKWWGCIVPLVFMVILCFSIIVML